ncbi:hypothetical protein [Yinghuangia soli]|uniref:Uncharacterized protein n=1 Tax=Yinghuangia soli TaxID=2908204 RepID=A0AA41QAJ9_9ACTN|nr:hypothetical protein [Yinghuangia soli]MCF2533394.1 hypothetical protein [Yinghuangia soli]
MGFVIGMVMILALNPVFVRLGNYVTKRYQTKWGAIVGLGGVVVTSGSALVLMF